ncbi:MAG TPA: transglycosylase family protein [Trebonia sp.]
MGSPAKHARPRFKRRLPVAAAPALFGVAAAVALANAPAAFASAGQAPADRSTAAAATAFTASVQPSADRLVAVSLAAARPASARPAKYTVKSGDTLSSIAKHVYQNQAYWTALYWANHKAIKYANVIQVGQVLTVPAKPAHVPAPPSVLGPAPAPAPAPAAAPVEASQQTSYTAAPAQSGTVSTSGMGSFQQCVISRESGGNSQVMNSSGHYGLYQFSASTWAAYGGNPADFGNASAAEQNQVFNNAMAAGGASNWAPYDGC